MSRNNRLKQKKVAAVITGMLKEGAAESSPLKPPTPAATPLDEQEVALRLAFEELLGTAAKERRAKQRDYWMSRSVESKKDFESWCMRNALDQLQLLGEGMGNAFIMGTSPQLAMQMHKDWRELLGEVIELQKNIEARKER